MPAWVTSTLSQQSVRISSTYNPCSPCHHMHKESKVASRAALIFRCLVYSSNTTVIYVARNIGVGDVIHLRLQLLPASISGIHSCSSHSSGITLWPYIVFDYPSDPAFSPAISQKAHPNTQVRPSVNRYLVHASSPLNWVDTRECRHLLRGGLLSRESLCRSVHFSGDEPFPLKG